LTWLVLPVVALTAVLPVDAVTRRAQSIIGDRGAGLVNVSFPLGTTLVFVTALLALLRSVGDLADWRAWLATPKLRLRRVTT
jgi:hypothetical protein